MISPKADEANPDLAAVAEHLNWRRSILSDKKINLDIGGTHKVTVGLYTLTQICPNSRLACLFNAHKDFKLDEFGYFFLDTDGETFLKVINYLRKN